ncbi:DUF551 domain-containing protein [Escherichia coli]|uniref:DUF551 domain-containing protein n=3 Tax=Escherichia coli TaxID=562 RepID=UPI0039BFE41E
MITITKERLLTIKQWRETYGPGSNVVLPAEEAEELARIALASLEAEPVVYMWDSERKDIDAPGYYRAEHLVFAESSVKQWGGRVVPLYTAPPATVVPEFETWFNSQESGRSICSTQIRRSLQEISWNACCAAMLQAEPVSNSDELPLDYLQGHKDGLEWAAQLAEANHPQTGDWLYDDQIDLARAIRKGPDMPTVQGGSSPVTPDGWISCSERMPEKNQNVLISVNFDSSLVEPLICSARYTGSTFRRGDATIKPGNGIEQATHWMPLPEPPQEVNRG